MNQTTYQAFSIHETKPFLATEAAIGSHRLATPSGANRRVNLALQGGGAHGAFTWGVLEGLLEDTGLEFDGLSGSSAGAMNAVVFADGWLKGGRAGAREGLALSRAGWIE